jgi:outer membrane protein assembly factor BamB
MTTRESCDNCGAMLTVPPAPAVEGGFDRPCAYCGARNHEDPRPAPAAPPVAPREWPAPASAPSASAVGRWIAFATILPMVFVVGLVVSLTKSKGTTSVTASFSMPSSLVAALANQTKADGPSWESVGGPPVLTTIAGSEAVIGPLRNVGKDDMLFVGAFDGATQAKRWQLGPFGTYSQGYSSTRFAVGKAHIAVSDFHAALHIYDLETGKEEHTVSLTDKVKALCTVTGPTTAAAADDVWVVQIDKKHVRVDLATGTVTEAPANPNLCAVVVPYQPAGVPTIEGFETRRQFDLGGGSRILYGKKSPGTPTPMVALLESAAQPQAPPHQGAARKSSEPPGTVKWRVPLPAADLATVRNDYQENNVALCGKRFVGAYGVGEKAWHVTALDAETSSRLWDVTLKPIFAVDSLSGMVCSAARAYVVRMDSVDVIDLESGKLTGTIGHETYDTRGSR